MLDINFISDNQVLVKTSLVNRQKSPDLVDQALVSHNNYKILLKQVESLRSQQNTLNKSFIGKPTPDLLSQASSVKKDLKHLTEKLKIAEDELIKILELIPNIPSPDTPIGKDDNDNLVIKTVGSPPDFKFKARDHVELGELLNIIDIKKAGQVSGSRFGYFKNQAAVLEMAVMFYAFTKLTQKGWLGMIPPAMVKGTSEWKMGYTSNSNLYNAYYSSPEDNLIFISSSEHSVVPYHMDEVLESANLPLKYVNFSPCFRRESGTYGKDTRGLFRVHFFNKVEMNVFSVPDLTISDKLCLEMLANEEEILTDFGLPYQVVRCCTGDLPHPNWRMYDVNTWFPGQNKYRETHSCSNCTDYQARRLNTKVKVNGKQTYAHILNATVITDRAVLAILENFQQADGSILIPQVLVPLTGFTKISA